GAGGRRGRGAEGRGRDAARQGRCHARSGRVLAMAAFETIVEIADPSAARVLSLALKAPGLHPLPGGESGLPGMPGVFGPKGVAIRVPEDEAADARLLANSLLEEMRRP